jgi:hypothetical protein
VVHDEPDKIWIVIDIETAAAAQTAQLVNCRYGISGSAPQSCRVTVAGIDVESTSRYSETTC